MSVNVDPSELEKFGQLAHRWWDPNSEFKPLHDINPLRLKWIDDAAGLRGKRVLDVGCGGGILSEGMAACGAEVTGIDLSEPALKVAQLHLAGRDFGLFQPHLRGIGWWKSTLPKLEPFLPDHVFRDLAEEVIFQDSFFRSAVFEQLPSGPIHADLFRDNVLFDGTAIGGVIDFYFAGCSIWLFDLEATGLDTTKERVTQIAGCMFENGQIREETAFVSFVWPGEGIEIPKVVQELTGNSAELQRAARETRAEGATALYDSIILGLYQFRALEGRKALVVVTDGADNRSHVDYSTLLRYARSAGAPVYFIAVGIPLTDFKSKKVIGEIASESGGQVFSIGSAAKMAEVTKFRASTHPLEFQMYYSI